MKRMSFKALMVLLLMATVYFWLVLAQNEQTNSKAYKNKQDHISVILREHNQQTAPKLTLKQAQDAVSNPSAEFRFTKASDLFALALELLNEARYGSRESQYYLAKVLWTCEEALSLTEKLISSVETLHQNRLLDSLITRCGQFDHENIKAFGDAGSWINLSAKKSYGPALVARFLVSDLIDRNDDSLSSFKKALSSRHHDAIRIIGTLNKDKLHSVAWEILSCDFGLDCSKNSFEDWAYAAAAYCSLYWRQSAHCPSDSSSGISYLNFIRESFSQKEYKEIIKTKEMLKRIIDEDRINQLNFEQLLN